jgi:hypothetical protein
VTNKRGGKAAFARGVCDLQKDGKPDCYNSVAKRTVSIEEAESRGWLHFYDGKTACPQGHVAPRYISNHARCIDCARVADGLKPIYPGTSFVDDLTGNPMYVDPVARPEFDWTDTKKRQLLDAWINTTSFPTAIEKIGAQPKHVLDLLETDAVFKADYEAARTKMEQVQLWNMEGAAAGGSDRMQLAMGANKFTQFGAKTGVAGRPTVNSEQARAELTQLLSSARRTLAQRAGLADAARASRSLGRPNAAAADPAGKPLEGSAVLGQPYEHCDLVSDTSSESGLPEADAALQTRRKV